VKDSDPMFMAALAVLVDRADGSITYTHSEYTGVQSRLGEYVFQASVDRSVAGEPVVTVSLVPSNDRGKMPVS
jgi:hypothetical protein